MYSTVENSNHYYFLRKITQDGACAKNRNKLDPCTLNPQFIKTVRCGFITSCRLHKVLALTKFCSPTVCPEYYTVQCLPCQLNHGGKHDWTIPACIDELMYSTYTAYNTMQTLTVHTVLLYYSSYLTVIPLSSCRFSSN